MDVLSIAIGLIVGGGAAYAFLNSANKSKKNSIIKEAEKEAEAIKKDKILQAKEKFLQLKEEHEKVITDRNRKLQSSEDRFKQKDLTLSKQIEDSKRAEK
ncbi:MAG: ribonuclease Y, partial [Flavobacteriales bacterium]